jgi:hypothetical protein
MTAILSFYTLKQHVNDLHILKVCYRERFRGRALCDASVASTARIRATAVLLWDENEEEQS